MPDTYKIVIRRPKSTVAESNFGFTKIEFEKDDIKTTDGGTTWVSEYSGTVENLHGIRMISAALQR